MTRAEAAIIALLSTLSLVVLARALLEPGEPRRGSGGYVGAESCGSCHRQEYDAWRGSHHDRAMEHATEATVLGDFLDATFEHEGTAYRFFREGEGFRVAVGDDVYPVAYTFGVDPLQQVLLDTGNGRLQALPVAWDVERKRWYAWYDEPFELGEPRFNWNHMCADCHSTGYRKNYDETTRSFASSYEEIDVACEACHGPGARHAGDPEEHELPARMVSCAPCHSRRAQFAEGVGGSLLDRYEPAMLVEPLYFPDGQIRDEVYVWGSFLQSKMHNTGVSCMDCHDPHTAGLARKGNAVCTECHRLDPPERFPTLKKRAYDTFEHHRHDENGPGSACVDCHMATRNYMGVDERHDHSFRIPRPDLTASIGVPNACARCHADRPPEWAAEAARAMGDGKAAETPHFGTAFAANDVEGLIRVALGQAHPEIVAASAIARLAPHGDPRAREAVDEAAQSPSAWMRLAAVRAGARDLEPLLQDESPAVSLAAAERAGVFTDALVARFRFLADRAEGAYNQALVHERRREAAEADRAYRRALELEPAFLPAHFNRGNLLSRMGRVDDAADQFRAILSFDPDDGEAHYSLGLLYAEHGRYDEAIPHLQRAASARPRALYNLGLVYLQKRRPAEGRAALEAAFARIPDDNDVVFALAVFHQERAQRKEMERYVEILRERGDPRAAAVR